MVLLDKKARSRHADHATLITQGVTTKLHLKWWAEEAVQSIRKTTIPVLRNAQDHFTNEMRACKPAPFDSGQSVPRHRCARVVHLHWSSKRRWIWLNFRLRVARRIIVNVTIIPKREQGRMPIKTTRLWLGGALRRPIIRRASSKQSSCLFKPTFRDALRFHRRSHRCL